MANNKINVQIIDGLEDTLDELDKTVFHNSGDESASGIKTFTTQINVPNIAVTDISQKSVNSNFINNKFKLVDSVPSSMESGVIYFVKE